LSKENSRLRTQFQIQEEDRNYLIKQLVVVKKDNAKLRQDVDSLTEQLRPLKEENEKGATGGSAFLNSLNQIITNSSNGPNVKMDADHRYKEVSLGFSGGDDLFTATISTTMTITATSTTTTRLLLLLP